MRTQKRQVAVLGRAHTKSRAEHTGVCAVARGIHRSFRSVIQLRTEGARSAGVDRRSYPIKVRDARKACRLRATRRKFNAFDLTVAPRSFLIADGFNSFQPTLCPK
jgi:hypothetical protein